MIHDATLPAIAIASLAGSIHCAAMCGPLIGLVGGRATIRFGVIHAFGRLATYLAIGAAAGAVGHLVDFASEAAIAQRAATVLAGGAIIAWGAWQLAIALGARRGARDRATSRRFAVKLVALRARRPTVRAWLAGVFTGLLPCGWLWAFALAAAASGSALAGIGVMAAFWLGTVPALLFAGVFVGPLVGWLRTRAPIVSAVALVVVGLATLALRWPHAGIPPNDVPHCHEVAP